MHTLNLSGAPKIALDAMEHLGGQVSVRTLSLAGGPLEAQCRQLGPLNLLNDPKRDRLLPQVSRPLTKRVATARLHRWKPDVIYVNSIASLEIARWMRLPDAPVLLHVHELETAFDYFASDCARFVKGWPQHYIAVSEPVRDLLVSRYAVNTRRISLIHEFVRDEDFETSAPVAQTGDGRFVVGGAGTPNWRKGTSLWLQMAAELRNLVGEDKVRFVWVGVRDDADSIDFRNEARRRKIDGLVEFVAVTPEPFRHFAAFDVFAMTSWEDPCPVVVLENMMLRKPVLCFAGSGGAPEEVGDTGVVVDDFSPAAMARSIAHLMESEERRKDLGERARKRVGQSFVASKQAPKILSVIQSLVGERSA